VSSTIFVYNFGNKINPGFKLDRNSDDVLHRYTGKVIQPSTFPIVLLLPLPFTFPEISGDVKTPVMQL